MNTKNIDITNYKLKVLVCGPSGCGKTRFLGTFPNLYVLDFDKGMLTLRGKDVEYDIFEDFADVGKKVNELAEDDRFDTIGFDSLSTLSDILMERIQEANASRPDSSRAVAGKSLKERKLVGDPPTTKEYGFYFNNMKDLLLDVLAIDKNIVFTSHEDPLTDGKTNELLGIYPLMLTKLRLRIANYFDESYRMYVEREKNKPVYCLTTVQDRLHKYVGSRLNGLPQIIEDPSYDKIIELIKKGG